MTDDRPAFARPRSLHDAARARVLVVDVQEKLVPAIDDGDAVVERCRALCDAAAIFDIPVRVSEQYPQGLGPTVAALRDVDAAPVEKLKFSAADATEWHACGRDEPRDQVILCGIETHICVLQTALELQSRLWSVTVVEDAVGSRYERDHRAAIARLQAFGVTIATTEMVLFEWAERAGTDHFKAVSRIVRGLA